MDKLAKARFVPRALRDMTVTYSRSDVVTVSLIAAVVAVWAAVASDIYTSADRHLGQFPFLMAIA